MAGEKRERTRRRLVESAFEVVAERGFPGASVDEIAGRAGLSTGALYANFESKDRLLFAAFEEHLDWFEESLQKAVGSPDLPAAIAGWIRVLGREPEQFLVFVEFWAYALRRPELRPELVARLDAMRALVAGGIEQRARSAGVDPGMQPELAAQVTLAIARGLAFELVADPDRIDDDAIATMLAALVATA